MIPTGRFLILPDPASVLEQMRLAASLELPEALAHRLAAEQVEPSEAVELLSNEESTQSGYWRGTLGAMLAAKANGWPLSEAPEVVVSHAMELAESAQGALPELYTPEFNQQCAEFIAQVEARIQSSLEQGTIRETPSTATAPSRVQSASSSPAIRRNAQGNYATATFALFGDDNKILFKEEVPVEDLLFVSLSALMAARASIDDAVKALKHPILHQGMSSEELKEHLNDLRKELDQLEDLSSHVAQRQETAIQEPGQD